MTTVEYRPIEGFPNYRVGSDGTVWTRYTAQGNKSEQWRSKKLVPDVKTKYLTIVLYANGRPKKFLVHRIVLSTFAGECPSGHECCHNDGDRRNNRLSNLRWDSPDGNLADKVRHGRVIHGSRHSRAKLNEQLVSEIRRIPRRTRGSSSGGMTLLEIARRFGMGHSTIAKIVYGKCWRHVAV